MLHCSLLVLSFVSIGAAEWPVTFSTQRFRAPTLSSKAGPAPVRRRGELEAPQTAVSSASASGVVQTREQQLEAEVQRLTALLAEATTSNRRSHDTNATNSTNVTAGKPGESPAQAAIGLVVSLVQLFIFLILGIANMFFGTATEKLTTCVQAALASGWTELIDSFICINSQNVFVALERGVWFATGTASMAFASIKSDTGRQVLKGTSTGYLLADPLFKMISSLLFTNVAGCKSLGEATLEFPMGKPDECNSDQAFLVVYNLNKMMLWGVTFIFGKLGIMFAEFFVMLSAATTGGNMLTQSIKKVIFTITKAIYAGDPEGGLTPGFISLLDGASVILTYIFLGLGLIVMIGMRARVKAMREGVEYDKLPPGLGPARFIATNCVFGFILSQAVKLEKSLDESCPSPPTIEATGCNPLSEDDFKGADTCEMVLTLKFSADDALSLPTGDAFKQDVHADLIAACGDLVGFEPSQIEVKQVKGVDNGMAVEISISGKERERESYCM